MRKLHFVLTFFLLSALLPAGAFAGADNGADSRQPAPAQPAQTHAQKHTETPEASLQDAPQTKKETAVYEYFILRNDRQIGSYKFTVHAPLAAEGEAANTDDLLEIRADMNIKVKLLFVTAYEAQYSATSAWDGNRLMRHESSADYNGNTYLVNYDYSQNPDHLVVNSLGKKIPYAPMTLHPYYVEGADRMTMITEKGILRDIRYKTIGKERLKINANHYNTIRARIEGDVTRDLWYDMDGRLIKVAYKKDGATISLVRKGIESE